MTTDLPPIPPAVVEFAEKNGCINVERDKYFPTYKEAMVFYAHYKDKNKNDCFIILENNQPRLATPEEYCYFANVYF